MKTNPLTGRPYTKDYFNAEAVHALLLAEGSFDVPLAAVQRWTDEERRAAGDWALRSHLRASDNLNRVPARPECVEHDGWRCLPGEFLEVRS